MKLILILLLSLFFSLEGFSREVRGHFESKDYDTGIKNNNNKITFEGESTKMGLITSKWDGVVKDYTIILEEEGNTIKGINISFPISSMDSDNSSRNEKMQKVCLDGDQYKEVRVKIPGPIVMDGKEHKYPGTISIRGKEKPIDVKLITHKLGDKIIATGGAHISFKDLEIPDPSILVAKVADAINIIFAVEIE